MKNLKKLVKVSLSLTVIAAFISACSSSNDVVSSGLFSKRKYNKGFHINSNKNLKSSNEVAVNEKNQITASSAPINEFSTLASNSISEDIILTPGLENNIGDNNKNELNTTIENKVNSSVLSSQIANETVKKQISFHKNAKFFKQAKKQYKTDKSDISTETLLLVILCFILPFLAVYLHEGSWNKKCWISLLLTCVVWVPGVIYALYVVLT